jgi:hypothetical protein
VDRVVESIWGYPAPRGTKGGVSLQRGRESSSGHLPLGEILPADLAHKRGLFEAFLKVATIKKTPVLKREELYRGLIEPGWGCRAFAPAQGGERERSTTNVTYKTSPAVKSFLSAG